MRCTWSLEIRTKTIENPHVKIWIYTFLEIGNHVGTYYSSIYIYSNIKNEKGAWLLILVGLVFLLHFFLFLKTLKGNYLPCKHYIINHLPEEKWTHNKEWKNNFEY